ncbi:MULTISPECIES: hypothetical protein [Clostridia]|uniref:hypothetical protein n=1 Tax=Clostridia TaxID=186801 RepID=UPI00067F60B4|nr:MULTISPECIES: hypothetical protein [Clostridia]
MEDIKSVFASGVTITFGSTYSRLRFLMEDMDVNGKMEGNKIVADILMSPELLINIRKILNDNATELKGMVSDIDNGKQED